VSFAALSHGTARDDRAAHAVAKGAAAMTLVAGCLVVFGSGEVGCAWAQGGVAVEGDPELGGGGQR
jgi:hypothetical protein